MSSIKPAGRSMNIGLRIALLISLSVVLFGSATGLSNQKHSHDKGHGSWVELFNGKDLTGWKHIGPGSFSVEDGALTSHGGMGLLYFEDRAFHDFTLEIEWKVKNHCNNSGIFVRFPEKSDDPYYSVNHGYEIQIDDCDKKGLMYQTGSIYNFHAATKLASKPEGEWNKYEITVVGQHYTIVLNGEKVNEFDGERGRDGYIGLQNHDVISQVSFRKVAVKEIAKK